MKRAAGTDIRAYFAKPKLSDEPGTDCLVIIPSASNSDSSEGATGIVNECVSNRLNYSCPKTPKVVLNQDLEVEAETEDGIIDIAEALTISPWTPEERYKYLTKTWSPSENYAFPLKEDVGQRRKFNGKWLTQYNWLSYSQQKEGGFCKFCVIFGGDSGGVNDQARAVDHCDAFQFNFHKISSHV